MPLITKLKRVGRFQIHVKIIQDGNRDQLKALFGKMIITRAEMILHTGCIDYVAMCDDFDLVGPGEPIPMYMFDLKDGDWEVKKIEEQFYNLDKN